MKKSLSVIRRDRKAMSTSYGRSTDFVFKKGRGSTVWDVEGKKYLDFASGIAVLNAGHANKAVIGAVKKQLRNGSHCAFPDFYSEMPVSFSEELLRNLPSPLDKGKVFLTNSGTESIEAALKLAKWKTRRKYLMAFDHCFHGRTMGALSMTNSKAIQREGFGPFLPVKHVPYPYFYRMKMEPDECSNYCLDKMEKEMKKLKGEIAALFVEPIQGEGGYVVPPKNFFRGVRKLCDKYGILLCDDEIQAGVWRTGKFLAIENFNVKPDIVSMAKAIGGGLPLGAIIARPGIMKWPDGSHSNTFGGNLASCAAGLATLRELKEKKAGQNAIKIGKFIKNRLGEMQERYESIGDIRGIGLMIGIEIVKDRKAREPDKHARDNIIRESCKRGLILLGAGESVIRICPPLVISAKEAETGLNMLDKAMRAVIHG